MIPKQIACFLSPLLFVFLSAKAHEKPMYLFSPNKGQWHDAVLYRMNVPGLTMFWERDGITFRYYDQQKLRYIHDNKGKPVESEEDYTIRGVTVRTRLLGANMSPTVNEKNYTEFYENWFLGNDQSKHVSKVYPVSGMEYKDVYPGIDWLWYEKNGFLKFDFKVKAGSDVSRIRTRYDGQNSLSVDAFGNLLSETDFSVLKEEKPYAYQIGRAGDTIQVACEYYLEKNVVSYRFPEGYDKSLDLVIDPSLIFSTYSGSTANNFGYTATYDSHGHLYSGGNVFALGYPTTTGAFQDTYGGGNIDCAISKYAPNGTHMIWSTYLGGSGSEQPHSMVVNKLDQLFVFGTTGSPNFPTTTNAFDRTFNGGTSLNQVSVGYIDGSGSDIFVSKFSVDGSQLLASTYLGGSANDGLNLAPVLNHNYADLSRGEIDVDNWNNIYIATTTASSNFPVTSGAVQTSFGGGGYDGVVLKMDNSLTTLIWSTYLGGTGNDAVYSLAVDRSNNIVVTGGTGSADFPVSGTNFQTHSGNIDAFVTIINSAGNSIIKSIVYGSAVYDQAYFVELDNAQDVYLLGQTNATNGYFYTNPGYGVPNGGQFITKFTADLETRIWSTTFGNQNGRPDISPTAFLVDVCRKMYISGWGGSVNGSVPGSTVAGLPLTSDAYQTVPHDNDFYIMVLEDDATSLSYATYFGGAQSPEHVDGGTSRFNRRGEVYQSVCAGCGGANDFPSTPGAWSATNPGVTNTGGPGCNNGVFKFHLDFPSMVADFEVPPSLCAPVTITLNNYTSGANEYAWDLGNGTTDTAFSPTVTFAQSGVYDVRLVVYNTDGTTCNLTDTVIKQIVVLGLNPQDLEDKMVCVGQTLEIGLQPTSDPSLSYQWFPASGLNNTTSPNPIFNSATGSENYRLVITNGVCSDTVFQRVDVIQFPDLQLNDTLICAGISATVGIANPPAGMIFNWTPDNVLNNPSLANPTITINHPVTLTLEYGYGACLKTLERNIDVLSADLLALSDTAICPGDTVFVTEVPNYPGFSYTWSPGQWVSNPSLSNPFLYPISSTEFRLVISNGVCTDTSYKQVNILVKFADAGQGDTICVGQQAIIGPLSGADPFLSYNWTPSLGLSNPSVANPSASPAHSTSYVLTVHATGNPNVCVYSDTVQIVVTNPGAPGFGFSESVTCYGFSVTVNALGNPSYSYSWFTDNGISDNGSSMNVDVPFDSVITFNMVVTGEGCTDTIAVQKHFPSFESQWGELFMPNIFTPNEDGVNECFAPFGLPENCYWLYVYNRWGVLMFDSYKLGKSCWDGTYMKSNRLVVDGVYFWVLEAAGKDFHGTVTVSGKGGL